MAFEMSVMQWMSGHEVVVAFIASSECLGTFFETWSGGALEIIS